MVASLGSLVRKALYDANTVLAATSDDSPVALTVGEQALVGRITSGVIAALTVAEVHTLLGIAALTTKGDLLGYSTVPVRLPVGSKGELLLPDTSDASGLSWQFPNGGQFAAAAHQIGRLSADSGSTTSIAGSGLLETVTEVEASSSLNSASPVGLRLSQNTATTANSDAHIITVNPLMETGANPHLICQFDIQQATNTRLFVGFAESNAIITTDTPAIAHVGLSFSTSNGDTNFQIMRDSTGASSPTRTDTGVAVGGATFIFRLWTVDSGVTFNWEIMPTGGATITASGTISTDLPATSTNMHLFIGVRTLTATLQRIRHGGAVLSLTRLPQ